ncbi:hypothetical protein [Bradyrhizobium roseum]|uniref:hypothetical protein n=1 Tax=Bradyrhizobium roseum TaxID=3056648 RepID=UPI002623168E|nr:hypothetical protein [Bradyrhizobium roseus]WKA31603.1 hypothetical protein QUH67_16215 [Bradyrhizobium roseus]
MTDASGAAPAAAPVSDALPVGNDAISAPNPINNDGGPANVDPAPQPAGKGVSIDDALDRAAAKVDAKDKGAPAGKDAKEAAKDPAKGADLVRDDKTGKFAPKDPAAAKDGKDAAAAPPAKPAVDPAAKQAVADPAAKPAAAADPSAPKHAAPARFSEDAKAVWDTAPEPLRAEVARMERELTAGLEKHKASAAKFETIKEFDEMAARGGTDLKTALTKYTQMEGLLRQNPLKGLEAVCENIGVSLKDVARIVLEQPADQAQSQADATIRDLKGKIAQLEEKVGGVTQHFQKQSEDALQEHIGKWAESRQHYFEIIAPHVAAEMQDGAVDLDDAEARVFQKHPALAVLAKQGAKPAPDPVPDPAASTAADPDLEAQTLKGKKSITGAPSPGSNPAAKKRSKSIDEAIDAAFAAAG